LSVCVLALVRLLVRVRVWSLFCCFVVLFCFVLCFALGPPPPPPRCGLAHFESIVYKGMGVKGELCHVLCRALRSAISRRTRQRKSSLLRVTPEPQIHQGVQR
jgi:hypothetical protein